MTEPFLYLVGLKPDAPAYSEKAPADFKDPSQGLYMLPMTSRILAGDRGLYTEDEIKGDPNILKAASANTSKNQIRKNVDNDFISVRSNKTDMPCSVLFMLKGREKTLSMLGIDPDKFYAIFITSDETMFAEKAKYKPTQIKKILRNIENKMNSMYPNASPVLSTGIFEYDKEAARYVEV